MSKSYEKIIATRHPALAEYIKKLGLAPENTPVYSHVKNYDVKGKHVIGVVPLHLGLLAARVTIIPFGPARK
jgi:hypothetical protein